ncbi:MAG: OmpA family protein, partial [Candidatus Limivicinus sp.]
QFLADPENVRYVDSIVISGHTDSTGTDETNRQLSTDRANAVLGYLLTNGGGKLQQYASYFCAAGYGETRPVATNDTEAGRAQNRRIEISIILKDDSIMDIVDTYLNIDLPAEAESRMAEANG